MNFNTSPQFARWFIIISSLIITTLILWNVSLFFDQLKDAERSRMELYGAAQRAFQETIDVIPERENTDARILERALSGLHFKIVTDNKTIPIIKYNLESETYAPTNIKNGDKLSQEQLAAMAKEFELINEPIPIAPGGKVDDILYYTNSPVISQLKYFPVALMVIVILFVAVIYFYYLTSKSSAQNLLWAGMAKETAHQIGTPLSSLVGWTEILKTENVDPSYIEEMTKDIDRLEMITERFSKIGSVPDLEERDLIVETRKAYDYLSKRSSKLVEFHIDIPQGTLPVMLNEQLFGWTVENLVKNAIDAMKGRGVLSVIIKRDTRYAKVEISDTGKGIPKSKFRTVFEPGFTTKRRGWGLGLSLAKRIIEEYHNGKIIVLKSEPDQGTTMQISLKLKE
ncbi:sensor histidine kinase [Dokdonia sinensis]|uniref:histidine kinase n=1 Tax=Dokdonia sinensis TaxID=2479847 RepID=A0A3M0GQJ5_9FLAO|nr:HAMP domain-containing sensor histidine kinase [Dokdonia sinensis]RMB63459.1 sensor histidine kinase [Dokdonia sinensis]